MSTRVPTRSGPFGLFLIMWLLFAVALIFNQGALDSAWSWVNGLPLILQIVVSVLFLPITLGLWIWHLDWILWQRLLVIGLVAVANLAIMGPKTSADGSAPSQLPRTNLRPPGAANAG